MSTYETAETKYITVKDITFAYRLFGNENDTNPLVFNQHFRANIDRWDPQLINSIAVTRPVLLIDNSGVGRSTGEIPLTYTEWAANIISVVEALKIPKVDVLGHSMGGFVAQMMALNAPHLVRKVILAGTGPSYGEGVEAGSSAVLSQLAGAETEEEAKAAVVRSFFSLGEKTQQAGQEWWARVKAARKDQKGYLGPEATQRQLAAAGNYFDPEKRAEGSYDRLGEIKQPVFIANGSNDIVIPTVNSWVMFQKIPNAELHLFPDSGHGFLDEYPVEFAKLINAFLDK
ncbi:MAG: hypothetical protein MMC33_009756 [Icmadophila ericetorum]|nr:hypothetical protein [Icmadophila ericetorum]